MHLQRNITQPPKRAYSIRHFCEAFSVSRSKVYLLLAEGDIAAVNIVKKNLILAEEAERWLQSLEATPRSTAGEV